MIEMIRVASPRACLATTMIPPFFGLSSRETPLRRRSLDLGRTSRWRNKRDRDPIDSGPRETGELRSLQPPAKEFSPNFHNYPAVERKGNILTMFQSIANNTVES